MFFAAGDKSVQRPKDPSIPWIYWANTQTNSDSTVDPVRILHPQTLTPWNVAEKVWKRSSLAVHLCLFLVPEVGPLSFEQPSCGTNGSMSHPEIGRVPAWCCSQLPHVSSWSHWTSYHLKFSSLPQICIVQILTWATKQRHRTASLYPPVPSNMATVARKSWTTWRFIAWKISYKL